MSKISDFRSYLTGGGARPSQFRVTLNFPTWVATATPGAASFFLVKAASLPASTITPIEVPFRGRIAKIAGERQFQNWNVTVLNDNDFLIRNALEYWSNQILNHSATNGRIQPNDYAIDLKVEQLDRNDVAIKEYTFRNCFPQNIQEIGLDFGAVANIEEYQVEFSVDYWETTDRNPTTS
jgi:hypothetical protein